MNETILEMKNITKRYPGVLALDSVDLLVNKGEVLALVGENGAGKSTLMKILSGAEKADSGEIYLKGRKIEHYVPKQAIDMGISIMYQELNYLDEVSVAENIFMGNLPRKKNGLIDYPRLKTEAQKYMAIVGLDCNPDTEAKYLSVAQKILLEIAKAISKELQVLVMDEPTAALNDEESQILFGIIKKLAADGKSIIYISHRLDEVFQISDRVMIMRDGKWVKTLDSHKTDKQEIVSLMVGREIRDMYPMNKSQIGEVVLEVENLSTKPDQQISFQVRKGEILGMFGLMGAGRTKIVEALFGKEKMLSGTVKVNGKPIRINSTRAAIKAGLAYVPSERKLDGLILIHSVKENITVAAIELFKRLFIFINHKKERDSARQWVDRLSIKTPSINTDAESLSGGNQQKVVLAKWMLTDPKILIMNEPTRGIDVGAKVEVYKLMEEFCERGLGIIMISSELPEIIAIADRILTVHEGRITAEFENSKFSQEDLLMAALGE